MVSTSCRRSISTNAWPPVILVIAPSSRPPASCSLLEGVAVRTALPDDPAHRRRRKMRGQQAGTALGMFLDQARPCLARQIPIGAGERRPLRLQQLEGVVHNVAHKNARVVARAGTDHDIARRVTGSGLKPQPVLEGVIVI